MRHTILFVASLFLFARCSETALAPPNERDVTPDDPPALIATQSLVPTSIHVEVDDLPPPYATPSAVRQPAISPVPTTPLLYVPEGFKVNVFAQGLTGSRSMALAPGGDVFVAESGSNRITVLRDSTGDGDAELRRVFADDAIGLVRPFGLVFAKASLYVAGSTSIRRFDYEPGQLAADGRGETVTTLTVSASGHWTRDLALAADGEHMYVSIGSASNISVESPPRATVQVMNLDGSEMRTLASGMRNPVGLAVHPVSGIPHVVVNERDGLGDRLVPDYLTRLEEGDFYGWPYTYLAPDRLDPRRMRQGISESPALASTTRTPDVLFEAHSAPLGMVFYDGDSFPEKYRMGAFVAFHGSWNRSQATGYKVVFVPFSPDGTAAGYYEDFMTGFLLTPNSPRTWGRPVDLLVLPDGSLLISEDANGMIYRIQYYR